MPVEVEGGYSVMSWGGADVSFERAQRLDAAGVWAQWLAPEFLVELRGRHLVSAASWDAFVCGDGATSTANEERKKRVVEEGEGGGAGGGPADADGTKADDARTVAVTVTTTLRLRVRALLFDPSLCAQGGGSLDPDGWGARLDASSAGATDSVETPM